MKTINARIVDGKTVIEVPFWNRVVAQARESLTMTNKFVDEKVKPAISSGATASCVWTDKQCMKLAMSSVEFLKKYPGIAMVLSPETVVRMSVAQHVKDMRETNETGTPVNVASDVV